MKKFIASFGVLIAVAAFPVQASAAASAGASDLKPPVHPASLATFGDETLDLSVGWGDANACTTDGETTTCFSTEREMDKFLARTAALEGNVLSAVGGLAMASSTCGSSLKLYVDTSYGGSVLNLATRFIFHNLSVYGFSNVTSSYKIGACSSLFYDGTGGGGSVYPGSTSAGVWSPSMLAGWDNRVSSVYIG